MYDLNRATIIGRLTRDPELRTTATGKTVTTVGVATGRTWTDQSGVEHKETEFHNCVLWGKLADIAGQYLTKGKQVFMEGRLQTREWTATDGTPRRRTEIVVQDMIMLGSRGAGTPAASSAVPAAISVSQSEPAYIPAEQMDAPKEEEIKVEDIPF